VTLRWEGGNLRSVREGWMTYVAEAVKAWLYTGYSVQQMFTSPTCAVRKLSRAPIGGAWVITMSVPVGFSDFIVATHSASAKGYFEEPYRS
jgi:hypothetical protein